MFKTVFREEDFREKLENDEVLVWMDFAKNLNC